MNKQILFEVLFIVLVATPFLCFVFAYSRGKKRQKQNGVILIKNHQGRMTYDQAAMVLQVSHSTIGKYIKRGLLQKIQPVNGERYSPDCCILEETVFALKRKRDLEK